MIDFRPDLLKTAIRLDLGYIESWMLWPDDEPARARALKAVFAENFVVNADPIIGALVHTPGEFADIVRWLRKAPQIDNQLSNDRAKQGATAGMVLMAAVHRHSLNPTMAGLGRNKQAVAKSVGVSVSTIENVYWPRFKAVVHLWAAFLQRARESPDDAVFPCKLNDLRMFLAVAEYYRRAGETIRPPQARGTILAPGVALAIPIELPMIEMTFDRKSYNLD